MNTYQIKNAIDSYYREEMRNCEASDEEQYRVYEMFLEWYPENSDLPDEIEEYEFDALRDELWEEFCYAHDVDSRTAHFEDTDESED